MNNEFIEDELRLVEDIAGSAIESLLHEHSLVQTELSFTKWLDTFLEFTDNSEVRKHVREEISYFIENANILHMIKRITDVYHIEKVNLGNIHRYQLKYQNERLHSQVYDKAMLMLLEHKED